MFISNFISCSLSFIITYIYVVYESLLRVYSFDLLTINTFSSNPMINSIDPNRAYALLKCSID